MELIYKNKYINEWPPHSILICRHHYVNVNESGNISFIFIEIIMAVGCHYDHFGILNLLKSDAG